MRFGFVILFLSSALSAFALPDKRPIQPLHKIEVYAHRGSRALVPENTIPAYQASLEMKVDWVDMDVVLTQDEQILVSHDLVLNPALVRNSNGNFLEENTGYDPKRVVKNLTLKELQQYEVGRLNPAMAYSSFFPHQKPVDRTHMPTLLEVIRHVKQNAKYKVGFQIEMKTDPAHPEYSPDPEVFAKRLYQILKKEHILSRTKIQAFDFRCLQAIQKQSTQIKTAYLTSLDHEVYQPIWTAGVKLSDYQNSIPKMVKAMGGYSWEPQDAQLTKESLAEAHQLGLKVIVWSWPEQSGTAMDSTLIHQMIDWGVDGIITDDPLWLNSILENKNCSELLH